jgi:hypothetical protein
VLNHLLRTLPPKVGIEGAREFDNLTFEAIAGYSNDSSLPPTAKALTQLPKRLGGLGLLANETIKPLAAAASYTLSYGVLLDKGCPLSTRSASLMQESLAQCARYLNLPGPDQLLTKDQWGTPNIQGRAAAFIHETNWKRIFDTSPPAVRARLLENTGALARGWMGAMPFPGTTMLSDPQVRYALRRTLLSPFREIVSPDGVCPRCNGCPDHPTHHLACRTTGPLRTLRHTAIKDILVSKVRDTGKDARPEAVVGHFLSNGIQVSVRNDITAILNDRIENIDVGIVSIPTPPPHIPLPTPAELASPPTDQPAPNLHPALQWDEEEINGVHPQVKLIRKFRQILTDRIIYPVIRDAEKRKRDHYAKVDQSVYPFIISANGTLSSSSRTAIENIAVQFSAHNIMEQVRFRDSIIHRLSVALIQHASRMGTLCSAHTLLG